LAIGKVSFTADIWSDQNRASFMCITAHWISRPAPDNSGGGGNLGLKAALIAFHPLQEKHDGKTLANISLGLLDRAGITSKV
jgi:hypothetical protein